MLHPSYRCLVDAAATELTDAAAGLVFVVCDGRRVPSHRPTAAMCPSGPGKALALCTIGVALDYLSRSLPKSSDFKHSTAES